MINVASWGWPQIVFIALTAMAAGVKLAESAKSDRPGPFITGMVANGITYTLLICGGFFGGHH